MGSGIMNYQNISHVNLWQHPVNGKFIVVFTQRSGYIVFVVAGSILFAHDGNVMISAVHRRAHQVDCTRIHTDVLFVGMFFVDGFCYQAAIGTHHETAKFGEDGDIVYVFFKCTLENGAINKVCDIYRIEDGKLA